MTLAPLALALAAAGADASAAQRPSAPAVPPAPPQAAAERPSTADPVLERLVAEALERSPEYASARAQVAAERQRIPQAGALPDPTLSLGIQNDGFKEIQIGTMETSFWQVMVTQPFPWPGKRGARERAVAAEASLAEARLERIRLSIGAEVARGYVDLLLVRGQLALQQKLEALWKQAETMARTRYEVGSGPQSDLVRAQLERTRLTQQRIALEAADRLRVQALNRLLLRPLDEPIEAATTLAAAGAPASPSLADAVADALARSPELAQARLAVDAADRRVDVARRDRFPDLAFTAGVMPRGSLEPMWLASVGITLPVFSGRKQSRAVAESGLRREAGEQDREAVLRTVLLRAEQRQAALAAAVRTVELYRGGLLIQSDAAVRSTLSQYEVGKVTFASVLDVLRGLVADKGGHLEALAAARRLAIAQQEVSLEPPPGVGAGLASRAIPGAGAMASGGGSGTGGAAGREGEPATPAASGGMSGM